MTINSNLFQSHAFHNPDILEKLVLYAEVDEIGSNYPPELFNPRGFDNSDFYDSLAKEQQEMYEKKEGRTQIDYQIATINTHTITQISSDKSNEDGKLKRKSKWDQQSPPKKPATEQPTQQLSITATIQGNGKHDKSTKTTTTKTTETGSTAYAQYIEQKKREAQLSKLQQESKKRRK